MIEDDSSDLDMNSSGDTFRFPTAPWTRRRWLGFAAWSALSVAAGAVPKPSRKINTVRGPIPTSALGRTLMHEHLLIDFIGAAGLAPGRYDSDDAFAVIRPYLEEARAAGIATMVDATPEHLGRNPVLLRKLSEKTGVNIIASTGIYSARGELYIPDYARKETVQQLARRFQREIEHGMGTTRIRAGMIKTGVNPRTGPLDEIERKIARAAALASARTGVPVECHTDQGHAAVEQMEIFADAKAPARAFIWVHAHEEIDHAFRLQVAKAGSYVELDGIRAIPGGEPRHTSMEWHIECLQKLKEAGLLHRVLISQDSGWYHVNPDPLRPTGEHSHGAPFQAYTLLSEKFVPLMKEKGFSESEIDQLLIKNPAEALAGG